MAEPKMTKRKIELTLPASLKFSSLVRQVATEVFGYVGFTREWSSRLKLVVDELFMNANRYASKEDVSKIFIIFEYDESSITFKIDDEGMGKSKLSAEELKQKMEANKRALADVTKTSGRGLALISSLWTDELVIEDSPYGGIAISFTKKITTEAPPVLPVLQGLAPLAHEALGVVPGSVTTPVNTKGPSLVVKVVGEIDQSNMEERIKPVESALLTIPAGSVLVLDCSELIYFNSTFIGHLAHWHNIMQEKGGQLMLKNINKDVQDVLNLVGLSRVIYMES